MGIVYRRQSVINILMSLELMLLSTNINFVAFSVYLKDMVGQIFTLVILTVAAAEIAIGLAILIVYKRNKNSILTADINAMGG